MKPSFTLTRLVLATLLTTALPLAAQTAASSATTSSSAAVPPAKFLQLEAVEVLGSRIRRTEVEGPSPVISYDRAYIEATGAMNLADFLNYLPQGFNGIASGRASAPNELNPEFAQHTDTGGTFLNFVLGSADAPAAQTGVTGVSLRGLGSGSTLVLVDGRRAVQSGAGNRATDSRQSFVDLNGIPLGMIERVELITDGASALYGADAVAGVINIVLKKNWTGSEASGAIKAAQHGGGQERTANFTTGFVSGKLQGSVSVDYYNRAPLKASQRSFSKNQDHRAVNAGYFVATGVPIAGRDLRLNWGYPGVVQARTGNLAGFTLADGSPTRFALIKDGITGAAALSNFTASPPSALGNASGLARGNTANFLDILPSSERYATTGNFKYKISDTLGSYGRFSVSDSRGLFSTQPGVSSASTTSGFGAFSTVSPALINGAPNAFNPFGQDVAVGLIHYEFGSSWQSTHSRTLSGLLGVRGQFGRTWRWDAAASWQRYTMHQVTRAFNGAALSAALSNLDPAARLNPFVDARVAGNKQAAIYEAMALYSPLDSSSSLRSFDLAADGEIYTLPGGPVKMALGGSYDNSSNNSTAINYTVASPSVASTTSVEGARSSQTAFAEFSVPVFGKPNALPLLRRVDLQLADRFENHSPYSKNVPKYGVSWVPVQSLLLRSSYGEGFRAPGLTEYEVASTTSTNNTVTDSKRTPASTSNVTISRGSRPNVGPETSHTDFYGAVYEPAYAKGLNLQANYYKTVQENAVQSLSVSTIINNESLFPDRVKRLDRTASDIALNQPGQITSIDLTFINFGRIVNQSLDFGADYTLPWDQLGRFRLGLNAARTLESTRQLAPGQPEVVLDGDTYAPPKWKLLGSLFWNRGPLSASVFANYTSGFINNSAGNSLTVNGPTITYNPTPSVISYDVRGGYTFTNGVWRGYAKGLRVSAGVGNVFDKKPPFSDTVFGYNGGLHSHLVLGRSYQFSFNAPF